MISKVLIVDDEPLNIALYYEMLKHSVSEIIKAADGIEAVKIAEEELPDIIILDWNMPRMDGLEALKILKKNNRTKDIPVVMITGIMTSSESLRTALEEGAIDFIRKPFDKTELQARVKLLLMLSNSLKDLKKNLREIESSNRFIQSIIQNIAQPLVYYTLDGIIMGCNKSFEDITGSESGCLKNTLVYRHFKKEIASYHMSMDIELMQQGGQSKYEALYSDGNEYIFSKSLFSDSENNPQGILCIMTNISELKKAHSEVLELKKRELVSSALRLIQSGELNNYLVTELAKISQYTNKQGTELIRQLIKHNNLKAGEGIWQEFEARFENVYDEFYKNLNKKFPGLTPGEKKLCALLRLNLSTKDIAAITYQNPQSVDMARYRLRKKLNLSADENLNDFLLAIDS